jgi:tetratricopeptide (TPR) repeat protein
MMWVATNRCGKGTTRVMRLAILVAFAASVPVSALADTSNGCSQDKDSKVIVQGCTQFLIMPPLDQHALVASMPSSALADAAGSANPAKDCDQNDDLKLKVQGCTQFINTSPPPAQRATALLFRGWAYERLGQYDMAIADLTASIQISAGVNAYYFRGSAYEMQHRYDLAIADFDRAIQLQPDFFEGYQNRGICRLAKGDTQGALADFNVLVQKKPQLPLGYYLRARADEVAEQNDAAIADLTNVANLDPKWKAVALFYRGLANEAKGRNDLAESDFMSAIAVSSTLAMERHWVEYLKSIQADGDYANWSSKPYDFYLRINGL